MLAGSYCFYVPNKKHDTACILTIPYTGAGQLSVQFVNIMKIAAHCIITVQNAALMAFAKYAALRYNIELKKYKIVRNMIYDFINILLSFAFRLNYGMFIKTV